MPGVSSPAFSSPRNLEPIRISTQEVLPQRLANSVPWLGPPRETQSSTFASPPRNLMYQRLLRLPIEWAIMSTLVAPVVFSSASTLVLTSSASILFDCEVL